MDIAGTSFLSWRQLYTNNGHPMVTGPHGVLRSTRTEQVSGWSEGFDHASSSQRSPAFCGYKPSLSPMAEASVSAPQARVFASRADAVQPELPAAGPVLLSDLLSLLQSLS